MAHISMHVRKIKKLPNGEFNVQVEIVNSPDDGREEHLGARVGRRVERRRKIVPAADAESPLLQRARVLLAPCQHHDFYHLREMRGIEAADRAGAADADARAATSVQP